MTEQAFLVLTSLADGPRHGYGVIRDVEQISGGDVVLRPGTLYGVLDRLSDEGLVELDREEVENGRLRRYYRLTGPGRGALAAEAARRAEHARAAIRRLGTVTP